MTAQELQELNIGSITIPGKFITKCCNILAKRGSGKTYLAGVIEEEIAKAGYPMIIVDPMGAHWGIRELYPVLIFGGPHADIEIEPHNAELIASAIIDLKFSCLIDLVEWDQDVAREFVAHFFNKLYQLNSTPRHVIVEEADVFAPQSGGSGATKLAFKALDNLVRRGRGKGIGVTTITQRPAIIHKNILSQADVNIILNLQANRDLKAVEEMIDDDGFDHTARKTIISKIKRFTQGQALLYSPQWLKLTEPIRIRERETFHAGQEPEYGVPAPKVKLKKMPGMKRKVIEYFNLHLEAAYGDEDMAEPPPDPEVEGKSLKDNWLVFAFVIPIGVLVGMMLGFM